MWILSLTPPPPQGPADGAPLKISWEMVASRSGKSEERKPRKRWISNDTTGRLECLEFWGVASGDQHSRQAGESQLKVSNGITFVGKFHQCQRELVIMEAKRQQAEWFRTPNHWLAKGYFHAPERQILNMGERLIMINLLLVGQFVGVWKKNGDEGRRKREETHQSPGGWRKGLDNGPLFPITRLISGPWCEVGPWSQLLCRTFFL